MWNPARSFAAALFGAALLLLSPMSQAQEPPPPPPVSAGPVEPALIEDLVAASRILVSGIRGSRAPLEILPPLVLHGPDGRFTPEAEAIHRGEAALGWA